MEERQIVILYPIDTKRKFVAIEKGVSIDLGDSIGKICRIARFGLFLTASFQVLEDREARSGCRCFHGMEGWRHKKERVTNTVVASRKSSSDPPHKATLCLRVFLMDVSIRKSIGYVIR